MKLSGHRKQTESYRGEAGGGWGNQEMGINEGMCCDEYLVLYATNESSKFTSETRDVLYGD